MTSGTDILSTKAETLRHLAGRLSTAKVLPQVAVTYTDWQADAADAARTVHARFGTDTALIVRSSCMAEDSATVSLAGAFTSRTNVCGEADLHDAIGAVFDSYGDARTAADAVLVQPMAQGVILSGVAFTHDPSTRAPYRVISVARGTDTEAVTTGRDDTETYVFARGADAGGHELAPVLDTLDELEALIQGPPLDIEFALCRPDPDAPLQLVLFQCRPLVLPKGEAPVDSVGHGDILARIAERVTQSQQPKPFLCGRSTVFGVMPDWNPAEIVGTRPKPLAMSLYRELITDSTWAYQRHNYGYRNLRSHPLIKTFAGQPYIDVRLSFNSFIPGDLDDTVADRLVDHYIDRLVAAPALHDKIEFEIVYSCYTLDLPQRLQELEAAGFDESDRDALAQSLRALTNRVIHHQDGLWRLDAAKIEVLKDRHARLQAANLAPVERIYWLLEDCKRYGTLPFAGLARAGFIAVQMLRSLVATGVFSEADYHAFLHSVDTVSSQFARDMDHLDRTTFLARYGHLRPGTYDICSPRYDEAPDLYLGDKTGEDAAAPEPRPSFKLSMEQMRQIRALLQEHGLALEVVELLEFLQTGIEMREYAKFHFSRNLSDALAILADWGASLGFEREDLAYANISVISELMAGTDDLRDILARTIEAGRRSHAETRQVWLPPLITSPADVHAFAVPESEPNFITLSQATGHVVHLRPGEHVTTDLAGAIVFIDSADPGYDWLFIHGIAGLVTAYGGVNSHMAIRAGELNLPAVIGAGEALCTRWRKARRLRIDCGARQVDPLG